MIDSKIFIYGLFDPRDQTCFYVGQTMRGSIEPEAYVRSPWHGSTSQPVRRRIRHLWKLGCQVTWEILEEATAENLDDLEIFWIASIRATGASLTNVKDGGQHGGRGQRHSEATRAKIGAKSRLKVMSPESRAKIGQAGLGRKKSEEEIRKLRSHRRSPEQRARISAGRKGILLSDESRAKMISDGKSIGRPKDQRITISCPNCQEKFGIHPHDRRLREYKSVYCSRGCFLSAQKQGRSVRGAA